MTLPHTPAHIKSNRIQRVRLITLMLTVISMLTACQNTQRVKTAGYQTINVSEQRNYERAVKLNAQAVELIAVEQWDDAEPLLKSALTADTMFGPAHNNLGKVYYHQKKMYLAAWEYEYAIRLMPDRPEPRNNLAMVYEATGKFDDADKHYSHALELAPDNPQYLGNLARLRYRQNRKDEHYRDLLQQLVLKDTRQPWIQWATLQLNKLPENSSD